MKNQKNDVSQAQIINDRWSKLASQQSVNKTIEALERNGMQAEFFENTEEAKERIFSLIPEGAEIMDMTSVTLSTLGITQEIEESGKYNAVKKKLASMNREKQGSEMQKLGAAPEYAIGSVHAVTEDGELVIASNTGSQLPAYAYGANHVILVVGTQKIVKNLDEGMKRVYEHSLPLESERAKKAYGVQGSFVSKLLIIKQEIKPERIHVIFVNEVLGF